MTSAQKVKAWEAAATLVESGLYMFMMAPEIQSHLRAVVIPSLRRRANIISRNAPK
jgi:hypothetical protein